MYVPVSNTTGNLLYQGDLVKNFPFLFVDAVEGRKEAAETVILLSQSCDLQRRERVIIAPVFSFERMNLAEGKKSSIRGRQYNYWFYLPKFGDVLEESIVDFQMLTHVPRASVENYKHERILSFSDWGRHHLAWSLSDYFGRPVVLFNKKKNRLMAARERHPTALL